MTQLIIEIEKVSDGGAVLRCVRSDGSVAWQRNDGKNGRFFVFHDLRHYAVESVLGCRQGFYGLIGSGWEIVDTTGKGGRGKLPDEAIAVEHLVGLLDADSASGNTASAAEINEYAAAYAAQNSRPSPSPISEEHLAQIRAKTSALHSEWVSMAEGATMRFSFPSTA